MFLNVYFIIYSVFTIDLWQNIFMISITALKKKVCLWRFSKKPCTGKHFKTSLMPLQRVMPPSKSVFKVIVIRTISVSRACPENIMMFAYYLFLLLNLAISHFAVAVYCPPVFIYVHLLWSISSQPSDQWTVTCVWMLPHTPPSSAILTVLSSVRCPRGALGDPALMRTARIRPPKKVRLSCITLQNCAFVVLTERADYYYFFLFLLILSTLLEWP